jgi:NADPH:quinone reductase-like Zn-dependent oxidoreductase
MGVDGSFLAVHSVSLNPVGYKLMEMLPWPMVKLPMIPEGDFAGWVADPNGHESKWNINDGELSLARDRELD